MEPGRDLLVILKKMDLIVEIENEALFTRNNLYTHEIARFSFENKISCNGR